MNINHIRASVFLERVRDLLSDEMGENPRFSEV